MTVMKLFNSHFQNLNEKLVYLLLFLFPIAGMSVRHWTSTIFVLLVLISLPFLFTKREKLLKEERILIIILVSYVAVFFISSLLNSWSHNQSRNIGDEIRYLAAIPLLFLLRKYQYTAKWLLIGSVAGAYFVFAQSYFEIEIDRNQNFGSLARSIGESTIRSLALGLLIMIMLSVSVCWFIWSELDVIKNSQWIIMLMTFSLIAISKWPGLFRKDYRYRFLGDGIFFIPVLVL